MPDLTPHLSDEDLVLDADGEVAPGRAVEVRRHLAECRPCRARQRELQDAADAFARTLEPAVPPPPDGPRARLRARLRARMAAPAPARRVSLYAWPALAAALLLAAVVLRPAATAKPQYTPSRRLTPGVARAVDREQLCGAPLPKNRMVDVQLQRRVFQVYGIANADPRGYEVDYLITPALGGAEDIRNLWPQPYGAHGWNARVKDALEDRLRDLVCGGQVDLAEAQRDIATDWIAAYKKYFQTDQPRPDNQ